MKGKKFLAALLTGTCVVSLAACGSAETTTTDTTQTTQAAEETAAAETQTTEAAAESETSGAASIDFEDGSMSFVSLYTQAANADNSELSVVDYNGSKALYVKNVDGNVPYVAFDIQSMLGSDISKIASIEMTIATEHEGGFSAVSGNIVSWAGEDQTEYKDSWAVYLESKNPNKAVATIDSGEEFVADAGNIIMVTIDTDNGTSDGNGSANLYIDDVTFYDADGNVLSADTSVAFAAPDNFESSGTDYSNLCVLTGAVDSGYAGKADGWAQDGFDMSEEFIAALVPGAVVQIEYKSESGDMWLVMNGAEVGWSRVGVGNADGSGSDDAYVNNSKNIAQVTYEQIAAVCGDDVSTWGASMQCESDTAWEVYSVKVGTGSPVMVATNTVDSGYSGKADGWAQDGFDMSEEFLAALVPGSVVEIEYTSESDDMWIVMNGAEVGWSRVGVGNADGSGSDDAVCYNGKCYVTYEQIAAVCGDDVSTWGASMQCESDTAWEVYSVKVGTAAEMKMVKNNVTFEGFATKADAWAQDGLDMPQEIIDALVPGAVVTISYTSETGDMWIVMNNAEVGWSRVGQGNADGSGSDSAAFDGSTCQVTYEQIAAICGDDVSTWGGTMQCESSGAWEVYSVSVGQSAE